MVFFSLSVCLNSILGSSDFTALPRHHPLSHMFKDGLGSADLQPRLLFLAEIVPVLIAVTSTPPQRLLCGSGRAERQSLEYTHQFVASILIPSKQTKTNCGELPLFFSFVKVLSSGQHFLPPPQHTNHSTGVVGNLLTCKLALSIQAPQESKNAISNWLGLYCQFFIGCSLNPAHTYMLPVCTCPSLYAVCIRSAKHV